MFAAPRLLQSREKEAARLGKWGGARNIRPGGRKHGKWRVGRVFPACVSIGSMKNFPSEPFWAGFFDVASFKGGAAFSTGLLCRRARAWSSSYLFHMRKENFPSSLHGTGLPPAVHAKCFRALKAPQGKINARFFLGRGVRRSHGCVWGKREAKQSSF